MSFFVGRDGQISIVRVGTIVAIVGVFLIGGAVVAYYLDQASRQVPLEIEVYPGAQSTGNPDPVGTSRRFSFIVPNTAPEDVMQHYQAIMESQFAETGERCRRYPNDVSNYPGSAERRDIVPYQFICLFDRSGFYATQFTKVTIQPGLYNNDPRVSQEGNTLIEYEQRWQR